MRINSDHTGWALATVAISAAAAVLYAYDVSSTPYGPSGGSWPGLALGITGTTCMLLAVLLSARKKWSTWRIGSALGWMKLHVWLGGLAVPLILLHSGFRWGGPLTTALMALFYIVIASGLVGLALQQVIPARMTARLPFETVHSQIDYVIDGLAVDAYELMASIVGVIPEAAEEQARLAAEEELLQKRPTNWKQMTRQRPATAAHVLAAELTAFYLAEVRPYVRHTTRAQPPDVRRFMIQAPDCRGKLERLQQICEECRQLRMQAHLHAFLHNWLFVHAPLSFALLVLTGFHIYFALQY